MIDWFLTQYGRKKTIRYLEFDGSEPVIPPEPDSGSPYLLYLHIPFCEVLCPYCSFNRIPFEKNLAERYFDALLKEMENYHSRGYFFESVYVGGGTPTVLPERLQQVIRKTTELWPVKNISVETNPNHLTDPVLESLKAVKVNRLSVGVQTFDDNLLKKLKRYEKYGSGRDIQERLSRIQGTFDTLNIDMIFNFPNQTLSMLLNDIEIIKEIMVDQATFYPLMISRTTKNSLQSRHGKISYVREKRFFNCIVRGLSGIYLPASAWCFTRKKGMIDEYIVDHEEYIGLGSGSFGYSNGTIYSNTFFVHEYIDQVENGALPILASKRFSKSERIRYDLLMRLFGRSLDLETMAKKYGDLFWLRIWKEILFLLAGGGVVLRNNRLLLTPRGQYYLVVMMREFFTGVNNFREIAVSTPRCAAY